VERKCFINYKFIKLQPFVRFVDVSATTAAFIINALAYVCPIMASETTSLMTAVKSGYGERFD